MHWKITGNSTLQDYGIFGPSETARGALRLMAEQIAKADGVEASVVMELIDQGSYTIEVVDVPQVAGVSLDAAKASRLVPTLAEQMDQVQAPSPIAQLLDAEPNAEAYAGDAQDMIATGDKFDGDDEGSLAGPLQVIRDASSELDALYDGTGGLSGEDELEDLKDIATSTIRAAHLLLHAAAEARRRAARPRPPASQAAPVDPRQLGLPIAPSSDGGAP